MPAIDRCTVGTWSALFVEPNGQTPPAECVPRTRQNRKGRNADKAFRVTLNPRKRVRAYQQRLGVATPNCRQRASPRESTLRRGPACLRGPSAKLAKRGAGPALRASFGLHHHQVVAPVFTLPEREQHFDQQPPRRGLVGDDHGFRHRRVLALGLSHRLVDLACLL